MLVRIDGDGIGFADGGEGVLRIAPEIIYQREIAAVGGVGVNSEIVFARGVLEFRAADQRNRWR